MRKLSWPKRDPIKNYFPLPNEIFSLGLSAGAIAVYGFLLHREDRRTYQCVASYRTIGEAVGMSVNTVHIHLHHRNTSAHHVRSQIYFAPTPCPFPSLACDLAHIVVLRKLRPENPIALH